MSGIDWDRYPLVARNDLARSLLTIEEGLGRAPNTLDAYARGREDFFKLCCRLGVAPEVAKKEHVARWARELMAPSEQSRKALSNATIQLRVTSVRLFFDHVIEAGLRSDNPVGRGRYTPGKKCVGREERGLVPRYEKLPRIPNDEQWAALLRAVEVEPLRNRTMFALCYDAALRREELCALTTADFDFAYRLVTIRAETSKSRRTRVVPFSKTTASLVGAYQRHRRQVTSEPGPLFRSESARNYGEPLSIWSWSKICERIAEMSGVTLFSTHTLRHVCLTDLARSGWDIHEIATFAGHRHIDTTKIYIHLGADDLAKKITDGMAQIHAWRVASIEEKLR